MASTTGWPCKLGIMLPMFEGDMGGETPRWRDLAAMARLAEDMGFDSVWVPDHLISQNETNPVEQEGWWECWSILAALAAVTQRVELGSLVTPTSFRNPALLAKMADTVDEISGGRVILGLGAGYHEPEYRAFGFPYAHRASRFEEAFTIVRRLLQEGRVDFEGRYYSARECELRPRGPRPQGPPLMIGSDGPRVLHVAVPYVAMWNSWLGGGRSQPDEVPALRERVDAVCRDVGRDPSSLDRSVTIMVDQSGTHVTGAPPEGGIVEPLTGTPEAIAAGIRGFVDEGISEIQLYLVPNTIESLERFGAVLDELGQTEPAAIKVETVPSGTEASA